MPPPSPFLLFLGTEISKMIGRQNRYHPLDQRPVGGGLFPGGGFVTAEKIEKARSHPCCDQVCLIVDEAHSIVATIVLNKFPL